MAYTVYAPYVFDIIMGQRVLRHGFGVYTTNAVKKFNLGHVDQLGHLNSFINYNLTLE